MNAEQIKARLLELDKELYFKPRDYWTGLKFTPDEAVAHHRETVRLTHQLFELSGEIWKSWKPEMSFQERRYIEKNYPGGVTRR